MKRNEYVSTHWVPQPNHLNERKKVKKLNSDFDFNHCKRKKRKNPYKFIHQSSLIFIDCNLQRKKTSYNKFFLENFQNAYTTKEIDWSYIL